MCWAATSASKGPARVTISFKLMPDCDSAIVVGAEVVLASGSLPLMIGWPHHGQVPARSFACVRRQRSSIEIHSNVFWLFSSLPPPWGFDSRFVHVNQGLTPPGY